MKIRLVLATVMAAAVLCAAEQSSQPRTQHAAAKPAPLVSYIKAGKLFDSTSDSYRESVVIVVEGDRIKSIAPTAIAEIGRAHV